MTKLLTLVSFCFLSKALVRSAELPVVVGTWHFEKAVETAWNVIGDSIKSKAAIDAIEAGCSYCEDNECDGAVGPGGSPDEDGNTRLDAMLMDGTTANVGAVGSIGRIKSASSVARHVLDYTKHTLIAGDLATDFAKQMGFKEQSINSKKSILQWKRWKRGDCQPNFRTNVSPDPTTSCGPYKPSWYNPGETNDALIDAGNHDTIGFVAIDKNGEIAAGTSTNGLTFKIPGRVGDSPIPGAGAYADSDVGGAAATGNGDIMMRFLPTFLAVELMRGGASPMEAAETAIRRITKKYPNFGGAVITLNKNGTVGAACHGLRYPFPYPVGRPSYGGVRTLTVKCLDHE